MEAPSDELVCEQMSLMPPKSSTRTSTSSLRSQKCLVKTCGFEASARDLLLAILVWTVLSKLASIRGPQSNVGQLTVWASWIGEVPTAAELYGDSSSDAPSTDAFEDDDEDEELDSAASNEYPDNENDNENDNDNDEAYEDADDNQESRIRELWLRPGEQIGQASTVSSIGQQVRQKRSASNDKEDSDMNLDDSDEDNWVNDGVDDIHIDPETRRAASELSYDTDKNLDAEYEPEVANRTRVTTITEVIPVSLSSNEDDQDSSKLEPQYVQAPLSESASYLPAAQLSLEEAQRLLEEQAVAIGRR